jgi:hypothetical protein
VLPVATSLRRVSSSVRSSTIWVSSVRTFAPNGLP